MSLRASLREMRFVLHELNTQSETLQGGAKSLMALAEEDCAF